MSLWIIILHSCFNVPFPFWINLLNPQPLEGATLQTCILAPRGTAPWAGDGHTPKGNQLVIKAEPNIVTFWEFGIEILRDGICLLQGKKTLTQRKPAKLQYWPSSQEEGPGTPVAEVPRTVPNPPLPEVWWTVFLWRPGKPLGIFILSVDGLGSYSLQANESLPKPMVILLEKAMAPHSSTLAWKIPRTEESGRLQSMGLRRVGHEWATSLSLFTFMHWRRKWQPTPMFLPGESQEWESLVGCCLQGRTESDTTEAT